MKRAARVVAILIGLTALAGCTPLYIPPVPSAPEIDEPVRLGRESSLEASGGILVAVLEVRSVSVPGWLTLQWYDPTLAEVASDSVWLEATGEPHELQIGIPDHVSVRAGRWRLVVAFDGIVLRQLDIEVPEG